MNRIEYAAFGIIYTGKGNQFSRKIPIYYNHQEPFFPSLVLAFEAIEYEKQVFSFHEYVILQVIDGRMDAQVYYQTIKNHPLQKGQ